MIFEIDSFPESKFDKECFENFLEYVEDELLLEGFQSISLSFVSEDDIREINYEHRDKDVATDILTFCLEGPIPGMGLGDIYLCPSKFDNQFNLDTEQHILHFLVAHGIYHLLGWTHETSEDFNKMMDAQVKLVKGFEAENK
jgi:probable rRNA maturation factor